MDIGPAVPTFAALAPLYALTTIRRFNGVVCSCVVRNSWERSCPQAPCISDAASALAFQRDRVRLNGMTSHQAILDPKQQV